ncbi:hypothetical protein N7493_006194 [Penicillium malachiteum]|uniref:Uncharacterized protein n=1 Tax=Penicillium malachiteum TaxID=1324776 RepID=A0AAD6HKG7_9EURO|nr:hypothetical protein N7493_006194 [Penicillium malachiteum]
MSPTRKRMRGAGKPHGDLARKKARLSRHGLIAGGSGGQIVQPDEISEQSSELSPPVSMELSDDEPAPAPADPPPAVGVGSNSWIFTTMADLPLSVRNRQVASCDIEFLQVDPIQGHEMNHTIMRLGYRHPQTRNTDATPAGTRGITIDWIVHNGTDGFATPTRVRVRNYSYAPPHQLADFVQNIPIRVPGGGARRRHKTVGDYFRILQESGMLPTAFTNYENIVHVGCRDTIAQYLTHLNQAEILDIEVGGAALNYDFFNFFYPNGAVPSPDDVIRARFPVDYVRTLIPEITYDGAAVDEFAAQYNAMLPVP